jgi:hypothetical protein
MWLNEFQIRSMWLSLLDFSCSRDWILDSTGIVMHLLTAQGRVGSLRGPWWSPQPINVPMRSVIRSRGFDSPPRHV